ncbi:MAG: MATE family efflux transporter, partial [Proteobacteria bacterium]|nr:MATE family efflux transporter [Pseudomonadota bacterium]
MSLHPYRTIWVLAWPQVLMMVFHFLIGAVDVKVAGILNAQVQAALGMISQVMMFFLVVAIAMANGAVAAISQSVGAGMTVRVKRYVGLVLLLALGLGFLIMALSFPIRGTLLDALQVNPEIRDITRYFLEIYLLVTPFYYLLLITNAIFRSQKQVMQPLYTMVLITVLNAIGDLGFGLGWFGMPNLGYKGMAWATFAAIAGGSLLNLTQLMRQGLVSRASFAPWRWVRRATPYIFKVAWPSALMSMVWNSGYLVLFALTSSLPIGSEAANVVLAGLTVGNRIEALLFLPAFAFNMTASILVGHWLGAGKPDEAKRFGYRILAIGMVTIGAITLVLWLFVEPVTGYFAADAAVKDAGVSYLSWNMAAVPFTIISMLLGGAFNGAGATILNLGIFGMAIWFVRLPLAWWLGHETMQSADGIWIAMFVSQLIQAIVIFFVYHFY